MNKPPSSLTHLSTGCIPTAARRNPGRGVPELLRSQPGFSPSWPRCWSTLRGEGLCTLGCSPPSPSHQLGGSKGRAEHPAVPSRDPGHTAEAASSHGQP